MRLGGLWVLSWALLVSGCQSAAPPSIEKGMPFEPDPPSRDDLLSIDILHADRVTLRCASYEESLTCPETDHWVTTLNGQGCRDRARADAFIKSEAGRLRTDDPKTPTLSELKVLLRAESGAPFGVPQSAMTACGTAGVYKLEMGETKTRHNDGKLRSPLGVGFGLLEGRFPELRILLGRPKNLPKDFNGRWISEEGLAQAIETAITDQGPREDIPVLIDAIEDTRWSDVIHVMARCKKLHLERIEFAAPFKVHPAEK